MRVVGVPPFPVPSGVILLVEDDPSIRHVVQLLLEDEGLVVEATPNGLEAVAWAERHRPVLVVLDLGLPLLDGVGVAMALRSRYGERLPILVVSADYRAAEKARPIGPCGLVRKPFDADDLVAAVRRELAAG